MMRPFDMGQLVRAIIQLSDADRGVGDSINFLP